MESDIVEIGELSVSEPAVGQERREQILEGAEAVFSEKGYAAARVDEIAEHAGVAKGTIYLYFSSKQDLFISLLEERCCSIGALFQEQLQGLRSPRVILRSLIETRIRFLLRHITLFQVVVQSMADFPDELQQRLLVVRRSVQAVETDVFSRILPPDYPVDTGFVASMVSGAVSTVVMERVHDGQFVDVEAMTDQVMAFLIHGVPAGSEDCQAGTNVLF